MAADLPPNFRDILQELKQLCRDVRPGEPLADHTTIRIGGSAMAIAFPRDDDELGALLGFAEAHRGEMETAILGGGANLFADSAGFGGLVVNTTRREPPFHIGADGLLTANGGARLMDVAAEAARAGWGGVDFMGEVPGTVGGAVVINAGTNVGGYVADRFEWVETMAAGGERRRRSADEMAFGYRTSALLHGREIVLRAAFRLVRCEALGRTPQGLLGRFAEVMAERGRKFPLDLPNFGSTFRSPGAPHPPAGKLIDDLGLKGARAGGAEISRMHGNFIVNLGNATSGDVIALMTRMHDAVLERYGVSLRPEVHYLCDAGAARPAFFSARATIL